MALSDADFIAWLKKPTSIRCVLVEAYASVSGVETLRYLSSANYVTGAADTPANTAYLAVVGGGVTISEKLSVDGSASLTFGDIEIINNGDQDTWLDDIWVNRSVTVFMGDPSWAKADFRTVFTGILAGISSRSRTTLNLAVRDKLQRLNTPLTETKLGGSTANKDLLKPLCFGECFNITPLLVNPATLQYQVHDGAIERMIEVRDNGVPVTATTDLATGMFTLAAQPAGVITCSVQGDKGGAVYRNTISALVRYIVVTYGLSSTRFAVGDLDTANLDTFETANTQPVGIYIADRTNVLQACAELASSVGAQLVMSRAGLLRLLKIDLPAVGTPTAITSAQMEERSLNIADRPEVQASITIGYNKNWAVQTALQTGITEVQKSMMEKEWLTRTDSDAAVATNYKLVVVPTQIDTMLLTSATATAEATRRLSLWKTQRTVFAYSGTPDLLLETLGGAQTITHSRFGLSAGVTGQVVGITQDLLKGRVAFEVLA